MNKFVASISFAAALCLGIQSAAAGEVPIDEGGAAGYWNVPGEHGFLAVSYPWPGVPLVVWSTFDEEGNPATVYGVGEFTDDGTMILVTAAAVDLPVHGTDTVRIEPVLWGELRFDIASCRRGTLSYQTNRSDFASGTDQLRRLTFFTGVGCTERAP